MADQKRFYYYECHITVKPESDPERIALLEELSARLDFRVSAFLMKDGAPAGDAAKMFTTGRDYKLISLQQRMLALIAHLSRARFVVTRYKIEDTLVDSNVDDEYMLLPASLG